jgi:conjugal transfer/type IV secretion protein DotA/TraY
MKTISYLLLFMGILFPSLGLAVDISWTSPDNDQSIYYLGVLFGPVGAALPEGVGGPLVGQIFSIFNIGVLTIGSIVVMYTVLLSTINTAQEGEVMGKKWSSIWIPIRAAGGIAMLLPTATGFSLIQIMMMGLILNGVHAANAIWNVVLQSVTATGGLGEPPVEVSGADEATQGMFKSLICKHLLNEQYTEALSEDVSEYVRSGAYVIGVDSMENKEEICGGLQATKAPKGYDADDWEAQQLNAASSLAGALDSFAQEAAMSTNKDDWSGSDVISGAKAGLTAGISLITPDIPAEDFDATMQQALEDGWIFAGSYYFQLLNPPASSGGFSTGALKSPTVIPPDYKELPFSKNVLEAKFSSYLATTDLKEDDPDTPREEIDLGPTGGMSGELAQVWDDAGLTDLFLDVAMSIIDTLGNNDENPIISLQRFGADMMMTVELGWLIMVGVIFLVALVGCIFSALLPICWALGTALSILVPLITILFTLLWSAGVALGLYLPLVPFLLYTFAALSWLILAIEAMVAAPIVALGLVSPSGDHLGKASPAVVLTLNVFLRPSLIVIGFVAGAQLMVVLFKMINFGFAGTIEASLTGIGLFGAVAIVVLYAGIAIITVHESFSLIHVIPDKVIRWIGGQVQDSMVGRAMKEADEAGQTAGSKSLDAIKAGSTLGSGAVDMSKDANSSNTLGDPDALGNIKDKLTGMIGSMMSDTDTQIDLSKQGTDPSQNVDTPATGASTSGTGSPAADNPAADSNSNMLPGDATTPPPGGSSSSSSGGGTPPPPPDPA